MAAPARPTDGDREVTRLAAARCWPELWRVVRQLPVSDALAARPLFPAGWTPSGDSHDLFRQLACVPPATTPALVARVAAAAIVRIATTGEVVASSFSPDGQELAVVTAHPGLGVDTVDVFDLLTGAPADRFALADAGPCQVAHLGDAVVVGRGGGARGVGRRALEWRRAGGSRSVTEPARASRDMAAYRDGIVVLEPPAGTSSISGAAGGRLWFRWDDGAPYRIVPLARGAAPQWERFSRHALAVEPTTGRLALGGSRLTVLDAYARRTLAERFVAGTVDAVCFTAPGRLVTASSDGQLSSWQLTGHRLSPVAPTSSGRAGAGRANPGRRLHLAAGSHHVVVLEGDGAVGIHDPQSLDRVAGPVQFGGAPATSLCASPHGRRLAVGGRGRVEVVTPEVYAAAQLLDRPMASTAPGDLDTVTAALAAVPPASPARPVLETLRACLEHRYGREVALGATERLVGGRDDIALAPGDGSAT